MMAYGGELGTGGSGAGVGSGAARTHGTPSATRTSLLTAVPSTPCGATAAPGAPAGGAEPSMLSVEALLALVISAWPCPQDYTVYKTVLKRSCISMGTNENGDNTESI